MNGSAIDLLRGLRTRLANNPDYARSVATSYFGIGFNVLVQLLLVPMYLAYLGKVQFGVLMIVLGAVNYLNIGIGWATSGAQRIIGEMVAAADRPGLLQAYGAARLAFVGYAVLVASCAPAVVWMLRDRIGLSGGLNFTMVFQTVAIAGIYFVALFDFNVDRITLIASGRQAIANVLAIVNQAVFVVAAVLLLRVGEGMPGVLASLLVGALVGRIVSWGYLRARGIHWIVPGRRGLAIFKRLIGPMGGGYAVYSGLILTLLQADVMILGWLGGAKMVADFVLIWKIADVGMQALWRIPESLQPYLVQMDVRGEHERLLRTYREGQKWMTAMAAIAAVGYAAFGPTVVRLWVGAQNAPDARWAYVLAGGAIFWLVGARTPAIFAFALVRLRRLNIAAGIEVAGKLVLLLALFPFVGYYSPLIAINVVHAAGVAVLYRRLASRLGLEADNTSGNQ